MKLVATTFAVITSPLAAQLLAHVETDKGTISVELQHEKAPLAVANFMALAQGTRASIDPNTGAVRHKAFYVGEKFFRIVNDASFKIAQTGSGTGTTSGGPGYSFKDEFDATLTHTPYVLSMANSGPNSNGSQIFFTGSVSINHLNNIHTVFGIITDPGSRQVIDQIIDAGSDGSSIVSISFDNDASEALAIDEAAQALPTVVPIPGRLDVVPGQSVTLVPETPLEVGQSLRVFKSSGLIAWAAKENLFTGFDTGPLASAVIDEADTPSCFYHLARVNYPNSLSPTQLNGRTLIADFGDQSHTYVFDSSGNAGTVSINFDSGESVTGTFSISHETSEGYQTSVTLETNLSLGALQFIPRITCGWDLASDTLITGRQSTSYYDYLQLQPGFRSYGSGTSTLSR